VITDNFRFCSNPPVVIVEKAGCAYIAGNTDSEDFVTVVGPDLTFNGFVEAFVTKVKADVQSLVAVNVLLSYKICHLSLPKYRPTQ
jgi:hypothetical protein